MPSFCSRAIANLSSQLATILCSVSLQHASANMTRNYVSCSGAPSLAFRGAALASKMVRRPVSASSRRITSPMSFSSSLRKISPQFPHIPMWCMMFRFYMHSLCEAAWSSARSSICHKHLWFIRTVHARIPCMKYSTARKPLLVQKESHHFASMITVLSYLLQCFAAFRRAGFPRSEMAGALRMSTAEKPAAVSENYLATD
jgi:hypothetical protein